MATPLNGRLTSALGGYVEPKLGLSLAEAGAIESVDDGPQGLLVRIVLGFPLGGYEDRLRQALDAHLAAEGIDARPA